MNGSFCAIYDSLLVLDCCNKPIFISIHTVNPPCSSYQYSIQMQIRQSKESTLALLDLVLRRQKDILNQPGMIFLTATLILQSTMTTIIKIASSKLIACILSMSGFFFNTSSAFILDIIYLTEQSKSLFASL